MDMRIREYGMTKPIIQIGTEVREMTDAEYTQWLLDQQEASSQKEAIEVRLAAKESAKAKLAALGLTEDEVNAIIGGI
jgi:hypothetical protein